MDPNLLGPPDSPGLSSSQHCIASGTVLVERAGAFGQTYARELFGVDWEISFVTGSMVGPSPNDGEMLRVVWMFPDEDEPLEFQLTRHHAFELLAMESWAQRLTTVGEGIIGQQIARAFANEVFIGAVVKFTANSKTNTPLWSVLYEKDGDEEDLNPRELAEALALVADPKRHWGGGRNPLTATPRQRGETPRDDERDTPCELLSKPLTPELITQALGHAEVPLSSRPNVVQRANQLVRSVSIGAVKARSYGVVGSKLTSERPNLTRLLVQFALDNMRRRGHQNPCFSTIQLNYNCLCELHVDKSNLGSSHIIALGGRSPHCLPAY